MEASNSPTFADLLRHHRNTAGLTQEELAERAGLSPRGLLYLERGGRQPYRDTVRRLADALKLTEQERATFVSAARSSRNSSNPLVVSAIRDTSLEERASEVDGQSWIYVAHAQDDGPLVERLRASLRKIGIATWDDDHDLLPGTPSWEQALREAIRAAVALVLIASPQTRASRYIGDELRIAELYGRRVYPLWVAGNQWMECIPLGWGGLQYLDARDNCYAMAVAALVAELQTLSGSAVSLAPVSTGPVATRRNPYKGLRPFRAEDARDFFGRDALIEALLAALPAELNQEPRFLALVGASGSGKSSVVLAGLLPRLQAGALPGSDRWVYLPPLVPGIQPLDALAQSFAQALPDGQLATFATFRVRLDASSHALEEMARQLVGEPDQRVVLVIDQGEELFAPAVSEEERRRCIELLVSAACWPGGSLLVLMTLRADFYDRPLSYPQFGALVHAHSIVALSPTMTDLRRAIEGPAALPDVQITFDDDLIGDILFDLRGQSGALPLLQFTLDQLYAQREGARLTGAAYRALGGVRGALARHAEATYAALLSEEHRQLARALFMRLINPGVTEQDTTRRRATMNELVLPDPQQTTELRAVIDAFIATRLLVVAGTQVTPPHRSETTIEVSHEALIREWDRLGAWLRETRDDIRRQQVIGTDAAAWIQHERHPDHLYRGTLLLEAEAWALRNTPNAQEAAFLDSARAEHQRHDREERAQQARQLALAQQAATRLRAFVGVLVASLVVSAGLTALALSNAHQAQLAQQQAFTNAHQADVARRQALGNEQQAKAAQQLASTSRNIALSRQLAAQSMALDSNQYDLALLLSLEAQHISGTVEARVSLLQGMEATPPGLMAFLRGHTLGINSVAISKDGALLASGSEDGTVRLWDMRRHRAIGPPLVANAGPIWGVAFSPNGRLLASGDNDGTVRMWDVMRQRAIGLPVRAHSNPSTPLVFSPDGKTLSSVGDDGLVVTWDVTSGGTLTNRTSVVGCTGGAQSWAVALSSSGKVLANGCTDGSIQLWSVQGTTLTTLGSLYGHNRAIFGLAFSPDNRTLASAGSDKTVRLWDTTQQQQIGQPLIGHTDVVFCVAFSPDGKTLASGSFDGTVRLWDVQHQSPLDPPLVSHTGDMNSVAFSPDGVTVAAGTADGAVALWDVQHRQAISATLSSDQLGGLLVSHNGKVVVSASADGTQLQVWNLTSGTLHPLRTISVDGSSNQTISPDGQILIVSSSTGGVQAWDTRSGSPLTLHITQSNAAQTSTILSMAFSPNGRMLATGSTDHTIQLWSIKQQPHDLLLVRPLGGPLTGHTAGVMGLVFSPNGQLLASAGADRTIRLWDVDRRRQLGPPLVGHLAEVVGLAFSPDGKILASASNDRTARLWDVAGHRPLGPSLIGHTDSVRAVAFSPDGTILASGAADGTVRLWDVPSGQPLGMPLTMDYMGGIYFSNRTTLITGGTDGIVRWNIDLHTWLQRACGIANRNLTRQEWTTYLGDEPYHRTCPGLPAE